MAENIEQARAHWLRWGPRQEVFSDSPKLSYSLTPEGVAVVYESRPPTDPKKPRTSQGTFISPPFTSEADAFAWIMEGFNLA